MTSEKLGDGVYRLTTGPGSYDSLIVEFRDHIMMLEAGQSEARALAYIAETKKLFPNKPIRYVMNTHPHSDHTGGLPALVAEGATIITQKNNEAFFEKALNTPRTLLNDTLAKNPKKAKRSKPLPEKKVYSDGTRTVEMYHVSPAPHSNGLMVAYIPKEKVLFQGDFSLPLRGSRQRSRQTPQNNWSPFATSLPPPPGRGGGGGWEPEVAQRRVGKTRLQPPMIRCESPNSCHRYSGLLRLAVGAKEVGQRSPARGHNHLFNHREVRCLRFVEASDHAVHRAQRSSGTNHEIGPTLARGDPSPDVGDGLESAHDRRADGNDSMTRALRGVDAVGRLRRHAIELLIRWFVIFEARHARVQQQRRDLNAARHEPRHQLGSERPRGRRHLRASGLSCEDGLVHRFRPG